MFSYYPKKKPVDIDKKRAAFIKKFKEAKPIIVEGKKIANSWWAKAWNENLESYADYATRLSRGKTYLRAGNVFHLEIQEGFAYGIVQGSKQYEVSIYIDELEKSEWERIISISSSKISSLDDLASGKFPKELEELFTDHDHGLFPSPDDIRFRCNCPDFAVMCKHVAAVLYGIGYKFDTAPLLFFKLRGIDMNEIIEKTVDNKLDEITAKIEQKSSRVIDDKNISDLFNI